MLVFLLPVAFAVVVLGFYRRTLDLRLSFVYGTVPAAMYLVFTTEGLSVFHGITRAGVAVCWMVYLVAGLWWALRRRPVDAFDAGFRRSWRELDPSDRWLVYFTALIAGLVGLTAFLSAPNTWDAMEYHMPRVVEWISNRGVQLYPTIDMQQLSMPALSEYAILHLQLLLGSDRLADMVQWLAYVGSMVAASLIARELGANRRAQILAAVVSATIETGILGASGTKNDYTLAYWIAVAMLLLLRWARDQSWALTLGLGSALALAIFAKGTAYVFLPPLVAACFFMWDWPARRRFLLRLPVLAAICVAVSAPLWARNYAFSGSILGLPYFYGAGPNEGRMYGNGHITLTRSLANIIRNIGLNLAVPGHRLNDMTVKALSALIRALGVDPNDYYQLVHSQMGYLPPFNLEFRPFSETQSGNQVHFALLVAAGIVCVWKWRQFGRRTLLFAAGVAASFALYATMLRWSPWNARYQLPVFVLGAALTAIVLASTLPRRWVTAGGFALLMLALPLAVLNSSRPLFPRHDNLVTSPREKTYFFDHHTEFADSFIQAARAAAAKDCGSVAIDANQDHFEYPMMALVNRDGKARRLSYAAVDNTTEAFRDKNAAPPCVAICLGCAHAEAERRQFDAAFHKVETFGEILVFSEPADFGHKTAPVLTAAGVTR